VSTRATGNAWGLSDALFGFAVGVVVATVAADATAASLGVRISASGPLPVAVTGADLLGLWAGLVGAAVFASRRHGSGTLGTDYGLRVAWVDLVGGAALGLACQYLLVPLLYLPVRALDPGVVGQLSAPARRQTGAVHGDLGVAVLVALLVVGAPVVEELFFRGLLLRSLLGRLPTPAAIVVSALLFGLAHLEPLQLLGLAAFGVVLAVVAWRTERLGPGIAAHAAFNASAVISVVHLH